MRSAGQRFQNIDLNLRRAGIAALLLALVAGPLALRADNLSGQNQKQKKGEDSGSIVSPSLLPDDQAIDLVVGQMLGAWQVGDLDMMHKYYADDVVVVSAAWEQPLFGWENYARVYKTALARTSGSVLERSNSYTKVLGNAAWVTYQWRYTGQVDGAATTALGHTTLVLEKRGESWVIVLNHTSAVPQELQSSAAPAAPAQPANSASAASTKSVRK